MAGLRYTVEQLERLRESPLVKKPDELPSIEQWMDVPNDQNNTNAGNTATRRARPNLRDNDAAAPSEHRADRPLLNPMGQFGRRQSTRKLRPSSPQEVVTTINSLFIEPGEDTVLGPPKFNFASATRGAKPGQTKEPTAITSADGEHPGDRFPRNDRGERWRDRVDGERTRDKAFPNGRRAAREEGEGWTNVKGRKSLGQEDFDRGFGRNGDRKDGDGDTGETPRRAANARWPRREETPKEVENTRFSGAGQGGWRDRERNRERDSKDRDWARGAKEEDPEWMDTPVTKKEPKAHTQEDFQRWKEQMKAKDTPAEERDEPRAEQIDRAPSASLSTEPPLKMALTPSGLEPNLGSMFGNWGKDKGAEMSPAEPVAPKARPDKKSRFMTMFTKPEEQAVPMQQFQAAPPSPAPVPERDADQEGFQRILQMLGGTNIGGPQPAPTNGARQGGGISLDFQPSPQESQEPRAPLHQVQRTLEQQALLENILAPRPSVPENRVPQQARFASMSPDNALPEQFGFPRPNSNRPGDDYPMHQPPSKTNNIQDANLSAVLNNRGRENASNDATKRERDFLLTLMQQPRATPPQQQNQNMPRQPMEHQGLPPFFDQPSQRTQGQPKGRGGLPPGFMEDPRIHEHEMMRREAERREVERRELQIREMQQENMRNKNRGMPAGFPGHEDPSMAGLQRRNTAGEIPRQLTNMGIPSQPVPDLPYMGGGRQPGMQSTPQDRQNIAPPPGFGGPMRQPPGLGGPGPHQQQMGPGPSFSAGNTPLGHPPGFAPPGNMRGAGGMFPGGPGGPGGNSMQGPPQGYFPPPGYGPPMGMRGEDPRMMFEQQFGGPGPRPQGRPGPPNMY